MTITRLPKIWFDLPYIASRVELVKTVPQTDNGILEEKYENRTTEETVKGLGEGH